MDLAFTKDDLAFRDEVRDFVARNLPRDIADKVAGGKHLERDDYMRWQQALGRQGWLVYTWPKKHGGPGWTVTQRYIFENTCAEMNAPGIIPFGSKMVGPVIYTFGNDEQKQRFLPGIRESSVWWCQGYSEPGSGSDLASLRTKAVREGDHYIVNGSKTWNTMGHWADWIFCLVRTDAQAKPQEGISFLLIDMRSPGITVKPIIVADGGHEVNEVFFDNVKVPVENLVGKEGEGWTYAKFLLANERLGIAAIPQSKRGVEGLKQMAKSENDGAGRKLIDDASFREKIADLEIQVTALEYTELRALSAMAAGGAPGPEVSFLKIRGSEIQQRITELAVEAVGYYAMPYQPALLWHGANEEPIGPDTAHLAAPRYFNVRKTTIYGGSNEIQKNVISKMVLGL
ncbi:MAG: acyl-CoA dehydrogenase family protein [Alphaproteobacteria bacterium]|nr:acyl-CoA dehydrogenase family protein [Alphaproteobacteria bacterium]MCW5738546.1 acyl-CoA dehydrogenase family protein [Alphaproteobacteria bacterium]